jgi:hypothetical protein
LIKRVELASLLRGDTDDPETCKKLGKVIAAGERASNRQLPTDFAERLNTFTTEFSSSGRGNVEFLQAPLQADPVIAGMAIRFEIDAIVSDDSDYHMLVGPGVPCRDLLLTDTRIRITSIDSFCLATGQQSMKNLCDEILQDRSPAEYFPAGGSDCLLFDGMFNSEMRTLVGIALGCDYYVGGIKGVGPHTVQELLLTLPSQTPNDLASALANHPKSSIRDPSIYRCLAQSVLYEPTMGGYMRKPPGELNDYNKEFGQDTTIILPSPCPMLKCIGYAGGCHLFLQAEGEYKCGTCQGCLCHFCVFDTTISNKQCFACATSFLGVEGTTME